MVLIELCCVFRSRVRFRQVVSESRHLIATFHLSYDIVKESDEKWSYQELIGFLKPSCSRLWPWRCKWVKNYVKCTNRCHKAPCTITDWCKRRRHFDLNQRVVASRLQSRPESTYRGIRINRVTVSKSHEMHYCASSWHIDFHVKNTFESIDTSVSHKLPRNLHASGSTILIQKHDLHCRAE